MTRARPTPVNMTQVITFYQLMTVVKANVQNLSCVRLCMCDCCGLVGKDGLSCPGLVCFGCSRVRHTQGWARLAMTQGEGEYVFINWIFLEFQ